MQSERSNESCYFSAMNGKASSCSLYKKISPCIVRNKKNFIVFPTLHLTKKIHQVCRSQLICDPFKIDTNTKNGMFVWFQIYLNYTVNVNIDEEEKKKAYNIIETLKETYESRQIK